jgi:hypothetical protein
MHTVAQSKSCNEASEVHWQGASGARSTLHRAWGGSHTLGKGLMYGSILSACLRSMCTMTLSVRVSQNITTDFKYDLARLDVLFQRALDCGLSLRGCSPSSAEAKGDV